MRVLAIAVVSFVLAGCGAAPEDVGESPSLQGDTLPPTTPTTGTSTTDQGGSNASPDGGAASDGAGGGSTDAAHDAGSDRAHDAGPPNPCPALLFPSGAKIQTFEDAATTASYAKHLAAGQSAPECFLDTTNLLNPDTGQVYDLSVQVATHFQLTELVGTEVAQGYGHHVLMSPAAVVSLEKFREAVGVGVSVNSGFRSPLHQEAVCKGLCGNPLGCPGTCANNSRHMWGDAFDLPLEFYTAHDQDLACTAGFKFTYLESGTHLHVDQNPAYATCVKE
jgi:hypothetical protein